MIMRSTHEDAYFAASNSAKGFFSYYKECFDNSRIKHLYAIKGGPGTGKSYFLRRVARQGEELGWKCEYIYCSSDPDSLDGVILEKEETCVALLDATAPHVYEPSHPGVREDIVNLGAFWDINKLTARAEEIEKLNLAKGNAYRRAYRYLCGMGETELAKESLVSPYIRQKAIARYAEKLMSDVARGDGFSVRPALMRSVGMRGEVGFDTYFANAEEIFFIEDCRGAGQYLMAELLRLASEKQVAIRLSHDPIMPHRIDGIFFSASKRAFVVGKEKPSYPFRKISMRRFVDTAGLGAVRWQVNYADRMSRALLGGAIDALEEARLTHFALEEIYIAAMDFDAKEAFTKNFCQNLFDLQKE